MNNDIINARKQILDGFLNNLHGISNKEYQKRVWTEKRGPECDSFVEAVCDFFDLGEYIFNNPQGYNITDRQYKLLVKFRDEIQVFADDNDFPQEFINTPEWERIMNLAKEVLEAFNYQKTSK